MAPPSRRVAPILIWTMMLAPTVTSFLRLSSLSVGPRAVATATAATATATAAHGAGRRQSTRRGCGLFGSSSSSSSVPPSMVEEGERAAAPPAIEGDAGAEGGADAAKAATGAALGFMKSALYRVLDVNRLPPPAMKVLNFVVDDVVLGKVTDHNAEILLQFGPNVFELHRAHVGEEDDADPQEGAAEICLTLAAGAGTNFEERTEAVARVTEQLRREGIVRGWRDELYPVTPNFYQAPALAMERAAVPLLGALEYGVHINGLVKDGGTDDRVQMWMARRSPNKSKYPGMLDHLVAGGQPLGMSLWDNVLKECHEEAGIPPDVARAGLRPVSAISYETYVESSHSMSRAVLFNYDLYLPSSFRPVPVDGEVDEFFLWTIDQVLESLDPAYPDPIKPNCYSVIVDFLVRHGHLSPDTPGYLDVIRELRSGECR